MEGGREEGLSRERERKREREGEGGRRKAEAERGMGDAYRQNERKGMNT